jgi:hypothetical protein
MEEVHDDYSLENEARGMDVHLGFEGKKSNGHGEEIDKDMGMMKIIKELQKEVKIHRVDNKRLMRAREKQGELNMKLV